METVFIVCAVFGGTILVLQALMTLVGLGGDALHADVGGDLGHGGFGDAHADAGGGADHGHFGGDSDSHAEGDQHHGTTDHGSSKIFAMLSFRGMIAAMAFFGVGGMTAQAAGLPTGTIILIAVGCGVAAMYAVYWVMQTLASLQSEGTVRIGRAVGEPATVYLRIPGAHAGAGKIQINLQNRTMEYEAVTEGESLPAGARVTVVGVVNPDTVEVRPSASIDGGIQ